VSEEAANGTNGELGRILVADDNRMNRMKLAHSLEREGHSVALAEDGRQALAMLETEPFDVLLLDILMPEMDGFEVLEQLKESADLRHIPVIVISALDELDSVVRCIEMGAEDHLTKPFNPVFLRARLGASLRRKKLRDLEQAYLQQEVTLRQSEKLATLGRLSAGMAHELNNPAAAVVRGVRQVEALLQRQLDSQLTLAAAPLTSAQLEQLRQLAERARSGGGRSESLSALERSDREGELEDWLDGRDIEGGWELAPQLVALDFDPDGLEQLEEAVGAPLLPALLPWLVDGAALFDLLGSAAAGAGRISDIVGALKSYTNLDRAPLQNVDVHEGLEATLVMLGSRLHDGITVVRHLAADLPEIEAFPSELNQVWTHLIDNALTAIGSTGTLTLRSSRDGDGVAVEVCDDGSGIPDDALPHVFDPFFTTKPPGEGTGMGLNICHNVVVQQHGGIIAATSVPGDTRFIVRLPARPEPTP
jgi:signal transduction histidine kinase